MARKDVLPKATTLFNTLNKGIEGCRIQEIAVFTTVNNPRNEPKREYVRFSSHAEKSDRWFFKVASPVN